MYRQASGIKNNTFLGNTAGQKGTSIYARQISNFIVTDNLFKLNEPHYSYLEKAKRDTKRLEDGTLKQLYINSPYYAFLAKKSRSISFHETKEIAVNDYSSAYVSRFKYRSAEDEFEYM